jgi:hypothetical protein
MSETPDTPSTCGERNLPGSNPCNAPVGHAPSGESGGHFCRYAFAPDTPSTEALTPTYNMDNPAPGTRLWRLRNYPSTLSHIDAIRVALELDAERAVRQEVADTIGHGPCDYNGGPGSDQCPHGVFAPQGDDDA